MRKIGILFMTLVLSFGLFACDKGSEEQPAIVDQNTQTDEYPDQPDPTVPGGNGNVTPTPSDNKNPNEDDNQQGTDKTPVATPTPVTPAADEVVVDYENLTIYVPKGKELKIAQFADLHFSKPGSSTYANDKKERTIAFMKQVVAEGKPDLIVLSGDNLFGKSENNKMTGVENLARLISIMESLKTPYAFIYGNHDSEELTTGCSKKELNDYLLNCDAKYLLYGNECPENVGASDYRDIRYGTYAIKICEKESRQLTGALFMFDSGYYDQRVSSYSSITEKQITWYENKLASLQTEYQGDGVLPSIVFNHIQLPEYAIAYVSKYVSENPNIVNDSQFKEFNVGNYVDPNCNSEYVIYQDLTPYQMYQVAHGGPVENVGFFDKMVELGSTKAYFCGHAHRFTLQVKMDGIVMGFAHQTGFAPAEEINWDPRQAYVYHFDADCNLLTSTTIMEDESDVLGSGLAVKYLDSTNGDTLFTQEQVDANGNYVYTVTMKKQWARIKLYFNGEIINLSGAGAYTFTGDYSTSSGTKALYSEGGQPNLYYSLKEEAQYKITVNPTTKTVNIDLLGDEDLNEGCTIVTRYNGTQDSAAVSTSLQLIGDVYTCEISFAKKWGYVSIMYNGQYLDPTNTTFTGDIGGYGSTVLYFDGEAAAHQLNCCQATATYVITYNPTTKTVNVQYKG